MKAIPPSGAGDTTRAGGHGSGSVDNASWNGIHFYNFDRRYFEQQGGPGGKLSIQEELPSVTIVEHGAVPGASLRPKQKFVGVYDRHGQPVDSSIPKRGGKQIPFDRVDDATLRHARADKRTAYYLGYASKQYGHFILETLSRAWAWEKDGRDGVPVAQNPLPEYGQTFLGYLNGLRERIELVRDVTRFERVLVASPAFAIGREAYREFRVLCQQISERAVPDLGPTKDQPVYLSRSGLGEESRRMLVGEERLERLFEEEGFLILRPETLPIADQIAIFNRHRWIVAPLGSACHTKLFCRRPCNLLVLSKAQLNTNYLLCDLISEGTSHYANVLSAADLGVQLPRGLPEPLLLDSERILELVKGLGLVRPRARFVGTAPDLDSYKRAWISFVRQVARKRSESDKAVLIEAAAKVTASLDEYRSAAQFALGYEDRENRLTENLGPERHKSGTPRTIFVHIGPTKTGTSAIQSVMCRHDDSVVIYPKIGMSKLGSHHELVYSICGTDSRRKGPSRGTVPANAEKLLQGIAACGRTSGFDLMFSSEVLVGPVSGREVRQNVRSFVDALTDSLRGEKFEVEILFACRDHFERAASSYSQRLKGAYSTEQRSPDEFLLRYAEGLLYAPLGRELAQTGFKVTAVNYHPSQSFVARFLSRVGFTKDQILHENPRNVSLSTKALIAKLAANTSLTDEVDRVAFSKLLRKMPGYRGASRFIFGQRAAAEAEIRFCADRLSLEREFGVGLPDPQVETRENVFFLDVRQLHDIAAAAEQLGERGQAIVDTASQYLRMT